MSCESRFPSLVLRHRPKEVGLKLDSADWVEIDRSSKIGKPWLLSRFLQSCAIILVIEALWNGQDLRFLLSDTEVATERGSYLDCMEPAESLLS